MQEPVKLPLVATNGFCPGYHEPPHGFRQCFDWEGLEGFHVDRHAFRLNRAGKGFNLRSHCFRFGRVAESYAAQTSGDRNVGVVGLAIFSERGAVWTVGELHARDTADPFPQRGYATPPR